MIVAQWESRGGRYKLTLERRTLDNGFSFLCYEGDGCGGGFDLDTTNEQAINELQEKVNRGYFQPDANKTIMKRIV